MGKINVNEIINRMPLNLTNLEKARYVYIELGKLIAYDTEYIYGNSEYKKKSYNETKDDVIKDGVGICLGMGELYLHILYKLGFSTEEVHLEMNSNFHFDVVINIEDKKYKINLALDLPNIQIGAQTKYFGSIKTLTPNSNIDGSEYSIIEDSEMKEMDKKIGYLKNIYTDEFFEQLRQEMLNENNIKNIFEKEKGKIPNKDDIFYYKLYFVMEHGNFVSGLKNMKYIERRKYYKRLLSTVFNDKELKRIHFVDCSSENENHSKNFTSYIIVDDDDVSKYFKYSEAELKYIESDFQEFVEFTRNKKIEGIGRI